MSSAGELIFVSIAAYRDLQLIPTVNDCLAKARHPERLRFGICWQHGAEETSLPFSGDHRFRILDVHWRESRGACWARAEVMKLWRGEPWFLQVDSHCRFVRGWDEKLLQTAAQTCSPKPILSTYATAFVPGEREVLLGGPLLMALQGFTPDGIPHMKPMPIPDWQRLRRPLRARCVAAGFLFVGGAFVEEVGYDPELYFLGEETALTLRAFTNGYDLFHPRETILWHDYVRKDATKHWDDHIDTAMNHGIRDWNELDRRSIAKVRRLLSGEPLESYGLGMVRTLREYEEYAGISFKLRKIQHYTVRCAEPPNPEPDPDWAAKIYTWMARVNLDRALLPPEALEDPSFWYLGIHDDEGTEIYRKDMTPAELAPVFGEEPRIFLVCEFESGSVPAKWSVWPVSRSKGWLRKIEGTLADEDFTIVVEEPETG